MAATLVFFVLALVASVVARPSNRSSVGAEQGEPDGKIDPYGPLILDDMRFPPEQTKNAVPYDELRWPDGIVPYVIDPSLASSTGLIQSAFQHYHTRTCIKFVPRQNQQNYIHIWKGPGCSSMIGMINQGGQEVSLAQECLNIGTILHELGHTLGLNHMHNRIDRDDKLIINWQNIYPGKEEQFRKLGPHENLLLGPFDDSSIMCYGSFAFSKDMRSPTMLKRDGSTLKEVRDKKGLAASDVSMINQLYPCKTRKPGILIGSLRL